MLLLFFFKRNKQNIPSWHMAQKNTEFFTTCSRRTCQHQITAPAHGSWYFLSLRLGPVCHMREWENISWVGSDHELTPELHVESNGFNDAVTFTRTSCWFFPCIKQMTYFGIFTWTRNASSFGQGWPSWDAGFCPARCSKEQTFSSMEDHVSESTIFPKFLSKDTKDCFEIKTSSKIGCMMAARPETRCCRNLGTDQTDPKGSSALSSPSSEAKRWC